MPKYMKNTKRSRNRELVAMKEAYPDWTFQELGAFYGISKQRASYLYYRELKKEANNNG